MPRIRCHYANCIYLDGQFCSTSIIELDPDGGCMSFTRTDDDGDEWTETEFKEWDEDEFDNYWLDDEGIKDEGDEF